MNDGLNQQPERADKQPTGSRSYASSVLSLVGAAGASQAAAFAAAPLLILYYSPTEFGVFAMISMVATLLGGVSALRYERAIVLCKRDSDALRLLRVCLLANVAVPAIAVASLSMAPWMVPGVSPLQLLLGLSLAVLVGMHLSSAAYLTRGRRFRPVAFLESSGALLTATTQVAAGYWLSTAPALVQHQATVLLAAAVLGRLAWVGLACRELSASQSLRPRAGRDLRLLRRYYRLPLYSAPYAFVANLQWRGLLLIAAALGGPAAAGQFALAMRLVFTPVTAVGAALRRVTLPDLAHNLRAPWLSRRAATTLTWLAWGVTPVAIGLVAASGELRAWIPGEWQGSLEYTVCLLPAAAAIVFTCWLDQAFDAVDRQGLALTLEALSTLVVLAIATLVGWGAGFSVGLLTYSVVLALYNSVWLASVWKLLDWPASQLRSAMSSLALRAAFLSPALLIASLSIWLAFAHLAAISCLSRRRITWILNSAGVRSRYA